MRAPVAYESMFGNTHVVAANVADGLRVAREVTLVPEESTLADGEAARARRWGEALGVIAAGFYLSSPA